MAQITRVKSKKKKEVWIELHTVKHSICKRFWKPFILSSSRAYLAHNGFDFPCNTAYKRASHSAVIID